VCTKGFSLHNIYCTVAKLDKVLLSNHENCVFEIFTGKLYKVYLYILLADKYVIPSACLKVVPWFSRNSMNL